MILLAIMMILCAPFTLRENKMKNISLKHLLLGRRLQRHLYVLYSPKKVPYILVSYYLRNLPFMHLDFTRMIRLAKQEFTDRNMAKEALSQILFEIMDYSDVQALGWKLCRIEKAPSECLTDHKYEWIPVQYCHFR